MNRPRTIWLAYSICTAIVLLTMVWLSHNILRLEHEQRLSQHQDLIDENVRLALWQMDFAMSPLIATESARPVQDFWKRPLPPVQIPQGVRLANVSNFQASRIKLLFQIDSQGLLTSPQIPGAVADSDQALGPNDESQELLNQLNGIVRPGLQQITNTCRSTEDLSKYGNWNAYAQANNLPQQRSGKQSKKQADFSTRQYYSNRAAQEQQLQNMDETPEQSPALPPQWPTSTSLAEATWVGDELFLVRDVPSSQGRLIQGAWLNWEGIRSELLEEVRDLLPQAQLKPVFGPNDAPNPYRMATLPVVLDPGQIPLEAGSVSALQVSLSLGWIGVLIAGVMVAFVISRIISLSERRAAFVSAVTHELRTPLTTFKMYTEMLREGMLAEPDQVQKYLGTLSNEADRLDHLVKNVLSFARLEKGRSAADLRPTTLEQLVAALSATLSTRLQQADAMLEVILPAELARVSVRTDPALVEQIMLNLVDNACKYGRTNDTHPVTLSAAASGGKVTLAIADRGPGIAPRDRGSLFEPFVKGRGDLEKTKPGVGLGLSLSRRLAQDMRAGLVLDSSYTSGAKFDLILPMA